MSCVPEIVCPQCNKKLNEPSGRLVQDSCGHKKCRICLLQDEKECQLCHENKQKLHAVKYEDNHTAVITRNCYSNLNCNSTSNFSYCNNTENAEIYTAVENQRDCGLGNINKTESFVKRTYQTLTVPSHVSVSSGNPVRYECNICSKTFCTKSQIKYHIYCASGKKPYTCEFCDKGFISKSQLNVHRFIHSGVKPYSCDICNKVFIQRSKLNRHKSTHTDSRPFICQQCGKAFGNKESLHVHLMVHSGKKPFTCKYCSAKFNNSSNLSKHLLTHSKERIYMCDQCGKRFKLKWSLTVHRRSHSNLRPHCCVNCAKAFTNAKELRRHQLVHLDTKVYTCSLCGMGFRRKDNLDRHMKNTHPGKNAPPIKNTVKISSVTNGTSTFADNPNAIKVITASPMSTLPKIENPSSKPVPVINAPLKLAFKTSAFKANYHIYRNYTEPPNVHKKSYDFTESVNIYQRILSPHSSPRVAEVQNKANRHNNTEICQKMLSQISIPPLPYETSFEHRKHAIIKNIKFKLPSKYTKLGKCAETFKDTVTEKPIEEEFNNVTPLKPVEGINSNFDNSKSTYTELKSVQNAGNGTTSVIVNNQSNQQCEMHWRRRTLQNLNLQPKSTIN